MLGGEAEHVQPVPDAETSAVALPPSVSVTCTVPTVLIVPWLVTFTLNVYWVPDDPVTVLLIPGSG